MVERTTAMGIDVRVPFVSGQMAPGWNVESRSLTGIISLSCHRVDVAEDREQTLIVLLRR